MFRRINPKTKLAAFGSNLQPLLSVHLDNVFFTTDNKVGRNQNWIFLSTGASSSSSRSSRDGSEAVLVLAWSDLLDLFAGGMFTGCSVKWNFFYQNVFFSSLFALVGT